MNNMLNSILSVAAFASVLFFLPIGAHANYSATSDPVAQRRTTSGSVAAKTVGPCVEVGSFRIWVRSKLGDPSARLPDGTWLDNNFQADGNADE